MNPKTIDIAREDLFTDKEQLLTKYDADRAAHLVRLRDMYCYMIENPSKADRDFIERYGKQYNISKSKLYADLAIVKDLIPMMTERKKEYYRWKVSTVLEEVIDEAREEGDLKTMAKAAADLGKLMRVDEPDEQTVPYEDIVPAAFVLSGDPSVAGFKPMTNKEERIAKLMKRIGAAHPSIEDIEYEEADTEILK